MTDTLKRHWKLLVPAAVVLIGIACYAMTSPEPSYHGRTVSDWFSVIGAFSGPPNDPALPAIKAMGKDAVPFLMRQFKLSNSRWHNQMVNWGNRWLPLRTEIMPDSVRHNRAFHCLVNAGDQAEVAIPELIEMVRDPSTTKLGREDAIALLGNIHKQPEKTVPALIDSLYSARDINTFTCIVLALEEFGTNAKPAAPVMISLMRASAPGNWRHWIGGTIRTIDPVVARQAGIE